MLVGLIFMAEIIFGQAVPFFGCVVVNLTNLIILLGVILFLFFGSSTGR